MTEAIKISGMRAVLAQGVIDFPAPGVQNPAQEPGRAFAALLVVLGGGRRAWPHRRVRLPLARKIASAIGRTDYVRVAIEDGAAVPLATSGASILSSTVRADGCVIVPREQEGMPDGATVEVLLYDADPSEVAS